MNQEICRTPKKFLLSQTKSSKLVNSTLENGDSSSSNMGTPKCKYSLGQVNYMTPTNRMFNKRAGTFSLLPVVKTPPRFPRVINPFDAAIADRLHLPMIHSPLFRNSFGTPRTNSTVADKFEWTIDEIASLSSVNVEACETQFIQTPDPERDAKAQSAISLFFQQTDIAPSPIDTRSITGHKIKLTEFMMTNDENCSLNSNRITNPASKKTRRDGTSQTVLTLPPILPKSIDTMLRDYFTYNDEQQQCANDNEIPDGFESDKRDSLLRRKLFDHSNITMKSCDNDHLLSDGRTELSPPPQSPELIVATLQSPNRCISAHFADIASDESETKIVIPNGNSSFEAISPIASRSPPLRARRLVKRCGSDSSIDIYQSTPDRLTYASTSLMEIGGASEGLYSLNYDNRKLDYLNQTVDDVMQISSTSSMNNSGEHPSTPLRSRNRSANRKNLSRSFILFHEHADLVEQDDQPTNDPAIEIRAGELQPIDSGFDEHSNKNIYLNDVSMKSDINACLLSSTPSKVDW